MSWRSTFTILVAWCLLSACAGHRKVAAEPTAPAPDDTVERVEPSGARVPFTPRGDFSEEALTRGVQATTREECEQVVGSYSVWIPTTGALGECLRYWAAGLDGPPVDLAIVFFHGDRLVNNKADDKYTHLTPEEIQRETVSWARKLGSPYIYFGRPGTHGSSGDHTVRRRADESKLITAALDAMKVRWQIKEWIVAGQSGGGHVTASLLGVRSDIVCAVPTSSPSSPRLRWQLRGWKKDYTGFTDSYEPTEHLDRAIANPRLRVFVLGDPHDTNVPWASQTILADKLKEIGIPVRVITGTGLGPWHHALPNASRSVAGWCAKGLSDDEIVKRTEKGLRG